MKSVTEDQICISFNAQIIGKGMNPTILPSAISKL